MPTRIDSKSNITGRLDPYPVNMPPDFFPRRIDFLPKTARLANALEIYDRKWMRKLRETLLQRTIFTNLLMIHSVNSHLCPSDSGFAFTVDEVRDRTPELHSFRHWEDRLEEAINEES